MSKTIETLVPDIYEVIGDLTKGHLTDEVTLGRLFSQVLSERLNPNTSVQEGNQRRGTLRLSNVGTQCLRSLWFKVNTPEVAEPLAPNVKFKFLFGDTIELLLLEYARKAGHEVTGQQDKLEVQGVVGHRDAVIDGVVVDCKSASSASFKKFRSGLSGENDSFGYLTQLGSYLLGSREDPKVTEKNKAAFLVVDKQYGDIHLDLHTFSEEDLDAINDLVTTRKEIVARSNPVPVPFPARPVMSGKHKGKSKLETACSYCEFKRQCFENLEKDEGTNYEAWYVNNNEKAMEPF